VPNTNPGEKLFHWILNRYKRQRADNSWVSSMGREFDIPALEEFLLRSTTLMLVRRLIWNASWYETRYSGDKLTVIEVFEKDYLGGSLGFHRRERRDLGRLVFDALHVSRKKIPKSVRRKLHDRARALNQRCELGGCVIDYDGENTCSSFSLDHIWPHSLGGVSEEWNLKVACKRCNSKRQNLVEASDAHYEHFHVKNDWSSGENDSFRKELNWDFRLAALLQAGFQCEMCDMPVEKMEGGLDFLLKNKDENYNMFNILVACSRHRR